MATVAQINANRENAKSSTGPRTPEGKETSGRNALKHGFNAKRLIIQDDEQEEFLELRNRLAGEFKIRTPHMWFLFEQLIHAAWNMKRVQRAEANLFENGIDPLSNPACTPQLQLLSRYYARHERSYQRFLKELRDYQTSTVASANGVPQSEFPFITPLIDVRKLQHGRITGRRAYPYHLWSRRPDPADYEPGATAQDAAAGG